MLYAIPAVADDGCEEGKILCNPIEHDSLTTLLLSILDAITLILIPIMTVAIVYIGFQMVLAGASKPEKFAELKKSLLIAFIGLFIVLGTKGILSVIQNTVEQVLKDSKPENQE